MRGCKRKIRISSADGRRGDGCARPVFIEHAAVIRECGGLRAESDVEFVLNWVFNENKLESRSTSLSLLPRYDNEHTRTQIEA